MTSEIERPSIVTASASGFRRAPWQAGHGRSVMYSSIRSFWNCDSVSRYRRASAPTIPGKVVIVER